MLSEQGVGCQLHGQFVSAFIYADDVILFPISTHLNAMLETYSNFASDFCNLIIIIIIIIMFNHQYLKRCVQSEVVYRDDPCTIQKVKHKHNGYKQEQGCGVHANTVQLHI